MQMKLDISRLDVEVFDAELLETSFGQRFRAYRQGTARAAPAPVYACTQAVIVALAHVCSGLPPPTLGGVVEAGESAQWSVEERSVYDAAAPFMTSFLPKTDLAKVRHFPCSPVGVSLDLMFVSGPTRWTLYRASPPRIDGALDLRRSRSLVHLPGMLRSLACSAVFVGCILIQHGSRDVTRPSAGPMPDLSEDEDISDEEDHKFYAKLQSYLNGT